MTVNELLTLIALIVGPIAGVLLAEHLAKQKSKNERRHAIFRALLASKAGPVSARVEALNLLPYEFQNQQAVILAWRKYLTATNQSSSNEEDQKRFGKAMNDTFDELLFAIVEALKIGIEQRDILQGTYTPVGVTNRLEEDEKMRQGFMSFMMGTHPISVKIVNQDS